MTWVARARGAWGVLTGRLDAVPRSSSPLSLDTPPRPPTGGEVDPLSVAIALTTEAMQPDGGDFEVVRALFAGVPYERAPSVAIGAVFLAAYIGRDLAAHEPAEPARLLRCMALVAADRSGMR